MVTAELLTARREVIAGSADLQALLARLTERAEPILAHAPHIPDAKALLSMDGGVCPEDARPLAFDPWSPGAHRCARCGKRYTGERHDRHWARYQHLWLAERAAQLAALAALGGPAAAGGRAREILAAYGERYWRYPNRDNVLGPARLFFSTYQESIWLCNYLAAAQLLRAAGALDEPTARAVTQVADEAANLIGEFDEGYSNRQTWNNAALTAIAVWFEDQELLQRAIEGPTGLLAHLLEGFRPDGMWYEGENYHLFALRGLLTGAWWGRGAGLEFAAGSRLADRLEAALLAPARSALPDLTFPARKDARFGMSLAQPAFVETWEVGLALLGSRERGAGRSEELASWIAMLYRVPAPLPELLESYLHEAPKEPLPSPLSRGCLSWWALLEMLPELPSADEWRPASVLLEDQGLAILRAADRYVSLECGSYGGGHGHPDRLHLTLHANGVHWLADPGTGSYVARDLFWYRSTLAHNAPRLNGASQDPAAAVCEMFDVQGEWAWVRGRWGEEGEGEWEVTRSVVAGPAYLLDVVELSGVEDRVLELPWHIAGESRVTTRESWGPGALADEFVTQVEQCPANSERPLVIEATADGARLTAHLVFSGELLRATAPGRPGPDASAGAPETFWVARARGRNLRLVTLLEPGVERSSIRVGEGRGGVRVQGDLIEVATLAGTDRHRITGGAWAVTSPTGEVRLAGDREHSERPGPFLEIEPAGTPATGTALRLDPPPALDGSPDGFDPSEPLALDLEDQYRRSEEPYPGPDDFAARAFAGWDDDALYLAVEVTKPDPWFRPADAPPLRLDNEPDDIHSDGLQVYVTGEGRRAKGEGHHGYLIIPEGDGKLRVSPVGGTSGDPAAVRGAWRATDAGYRVTLSIAWPEWLRAYVGGRVRFDLIINEMLPGRVRRAGQLVWSGGGSWVWLRGDRQSPEQFGVLELIG
ncbi:MAG: heparinase II/III domain-containing protein [Gemmatimonadales bacterium]